MNNKLKPALLGGLVVGLISTIHSLIPIVSLCCCIWSIVGGGLAAFLYIRNSPVPAKPADGAIVGALAGVVGAIIFLIIYLPFSLLWGAVAVQEQLNRSGMQMPVSGPILMVVVSLIGAIVLVILSTLGGLLGVVIFEKRKGDNFTPPPPQGFSGPGGYSSGV